MVKKKVVSKRKPSKIILPRFDPTDREILRVLKPLRLPVTPNKIAMAIKVHPTTVQNRLKIFDRANITFSKKRGNRTYSKLKRK